jgi:hypothetical protein
MSDVAKLMQRSSDDNDIIWIDKTSVLFSQFCASFWG